MTEGADAGSTAAGSTDSGSSVATGTESAAGGKRPRRAKRTRGSRKGPFARLLRRWRETAAELRKVVWPTRQQLVTYTIVVIVFVSVFCAFAAGLDLLFARLMFWVFG